MGAGRERRGPRYGSARRDSSRSTQRRGRRRPTPRTRAPRPGCRPMPAPARPHVLAYRVIRLLLAGADPGRILCLTFTRAAAAEMAKRVFDILAEWTALPDAKLAAAIQQIEQRRPDKATLAEARRLFARALETPGGLKIQTIHAFCERLLHQFPFEANVAGPFRGARPARRRGARGRWPARTRIAQPPVTPDGPLGKALRDALDGSQRLHGRAGDRRSSSTAATACAAGSPSIDSLDEALADLQAALGLDGGEDVDRSPRARSSPSAPSKRTSRRWSTGCRKSGSTRTSEAAERLAPHRRRRRDDDADRRLPRLLDDEPTASCACAHARHQRGQERLARPRRDAGSESATGSTALLERLRAAECYEATAAMLAPRRPRRSPTTSG